LDSDGNLWLAFDFCLLFYLFFSSAQSVIIKMISNSFWLDFKNQSIASCNSFFDFVCLCAMGHEPSRFAPLDPDLEDENELLVLVPLLMEELLRAVRSEPRPQSTSILTGRGYVEELLAGNIHTFRNVARMDKETFGRLVTGSGSR